jgi:hypothetical protein
MTMVIGCLAVTGLATPASATPVGLPTPAVSLAAPASPAPTIGTNDGVPNNQPHDGLPSPNVIWMFWCLVLALVVVAWIQRR